LSKLHYYSRRRKTIFIPTLRSSDLEAALEQNNSEDAKNKSEVSELKEEIDDLNEKIETRNDILKDRLSSYQEGGGNIDYLEVFLGSKDFSEFVSRLSAVTSIANADAEL